MYLGATPVLRRDRAKSYGRTENPSQKMHSSKKLEKPKAADSKQSYYSFNRKDTECPPTIHKCSSMGSMLGCVFTPKNNYVKS